MNLANIKAEETLTLWQPCTGINEVSCIESISTISDSGKVTNSLVNPEIRRYSDGFGGLLFNNSPREWITPGVLHENGNEHIIAKVLYFPSNLKYCWTAVDCGYDVDAIVINMGGGWWNKGQQPLHFPDKSSDLQCGSPERRLYCTPGWGLNPDYKYRLVLRIPLDFKIGLSIGEGLDGNVEVLDSNTNFQRIATTVMPALRSYRWTRYDESGPTNFDLKADVSSRIIDFYIHSNKAGTTKWLSNCNYGLGMSIWHNGAIIKYPAWDNVENQLTLQLAGMHLRENGEPNVGTFSISVPIDIAQCIWKVDLSKKTSALMSATYDANGKTEIITTSSSIKNNIFKVTANGFHYSSPRISMKLIQEAVPSASPSASFSPLATPTAKASTPSATTAPNVKRTITCKKGKLLKKISGINPKCPTGYKVK